jgi:rhodanese-related sulfurtransferase
VPQKRNKLTSKPSFDKKKQRRKKLRHSNPWKWIVIGIVVIVSIAAVLFLTSRNTGDPNISVAEAYQKYQQGAFFLDVRSQEEWSLAHIANSQSIPLDELPGRLNDLPTDRDIVVVCLVGQRSQEGVTILRNAGFSRASCMTGGLTAWKAAGYPLEGSNP